MIAIVILVPNLDDGECDDLQTHKPRANRSLAHSPRPAAYSTAIIIVVFLPLLVISSKTLLPVAAR
jgi:hypothetical protein